MKATVNAAIGTGGGAGNNGNGQACAKATANAAAGNGNNPTCVKAADRLWIAPDTFGLVIRELS